MGSWAVGSTNKERRISKALPGHQQFIGKVQKGYHPIPFSADVLQGNRRGTKFASKNSRNPALSWKTNA